MPKSVNETVQEANVLHGTAEKYLEQLSAYGVTVEELAALITARDTLVVKDTTQKEVTNSKKEKTVEQDEALQTAAAAIKKVRSIAKIVYADDKEVQKEFHVGGPALRSVKAALTELAYIKEVATRRMTDLSARGLTEADLTKLDTCVTEITDIDTAQEMLKREQVAATSERRAAMKEVQKQMRTIRKSAEVCFADNPDILQEFRKLA